MDDIDKKLDYLRKMQALGLSPIKSPDYDSPLEKDTMKAKGGALPKEPVTKIKGMTEHIDTKQLAPLTPGSQFNDKISRLRAMKKIGKVIPGLGAVTALGAGMMSDNASASDIAQDVGKEVVMDLPPLEAASMVYEAGKVEDAGPQSGSFDDRLQKGQLTPEEMQMLRQQYLGNK